LRLGSRFRFRCDGFRLGRWFFYRSFGGGSLFGRGLFWRSFFLKAALEFFLCFLRRLRKNDRRIRLIATLQGFQICKARTGCRRGAQLGGSHNQPEGGPGKYPRLSLHQSMLLKVGSQPGDNENASFLFRF